MSDVRDPLLDDGPIPFRAAEGVQVKRSAKGRSGAGTHLLQSRRGEICQLGEEEFFIFSLLEGRPTFAAIQREFRARFAGELSHRHFRTFVDELLNAGIIESISDDAADSIDDDEEELGEDDFPALESLERRLPPASVPQPSILKPSIPEPPFAKSSPPKASPAKSSASGSSASGSSASEALDDEIDAPADVRLAGRRWQPTIRPFFAAVACAAAPLRFFLWLLVCGAAAAGIALLAEPADLVRTMDAISHGSLVSHGRSALHAMRATDWSSMLHDSASDSIAALNALARQAWADPAAALRATASNPLVVTDVLTYGGFAVILYLLCFVLPGLSAAAAAAFHGAPAPMFRLRLATLLTARLPVDRAYVTALPRKGRAWFHAAPLLMRLTLFVAGILAWACFSNPAVDGAAGIVARASLIAALVAYAGCFLTFTPLWRSDGRAWVDACLDDTSRGAGRLVVTGSILSLGAASGLVLALASAYRPDAFRTAAEITLCVCLAGGLIWLFALRSGMQPLQPPGGPYAFRGSPAAFGRPVPGGRDASSPLTLDERTYVGAEAWPPFGRMWVVLAGIVIAISVLFLPYPYESGGTFNVLPYDRYALLARVSGEVTEVLVREGEWVNEGQVVGTLSDWVETHALATAQAELEQSLANLQNFLISPKPEEVVVAQRQYEQSLSRIEYSKSEYERDLALLRTNDISVKQYESALSTYQQNLAAVAVTKANYELVRVGPTVAQISAARAAVHKQTELVAYAKDQMARTRIRATTSGIVVTPDPQLMMGQYLQEGTAFIKLEDHRVAHIEVQVPETDIRDIHLGSLVRARAWGYEYTTWAGRTVLIAPNAQSQGSVGNVIRVVAEVPNQDGLLRPTMSGDAKIETIDVPVWVAYTRAIMRFLLIEVWYWIP